MSVGSGWPRHGTRWRCLRGGVVIKTMMMRGVLLFGCSKLEFRERGFWTMDIPPGISCDQLTLPLDCQCSEPSLWCPRAQKNPRIRPSRNPVPGLSTGLFFPDFKKKTCGQSGSEFRNSDPGYCTVMRHVNGNQSIVHSR